MAPLSPAEARRICSQVACSLANLSVFRAYWSPATRRFIARSVCITRRFRLPPDAVFVGVYAQGIAARDVLADLTELIATIRVTPPACEAGDGEALRTRRRLTPPPEAPRAPAGS